MDGALGDKKLIKNRLICRCLQFRSDNLVVTEREDSILRTIITANHRLSWL